MEDLRSSKTKAATYETPEKPTKDVIDLTTDQKQCYLDTAVSLKTNQLGVVAEGNNFTKPAPFSLRRKSAAASH